MKIVQLPVRVYELGDRVITPEGEGTVTHDELEDILNEYRTDEELIETIPQRNAVIISLDEPSNERKDLECGREDISIVKPKG